MEFVNLNSTCASAIRVNDNIVTITFKGSNNSYDYIIKDDAFVNQLQEVINTGKSVGTFINRSIKEDQTLQIVALQIVAV